MTTAGKLIPSVLGKKKSIDAQSIVTVFTVKRIVGHSENQKPTIDGTLLKHDCFSEVTNWKHA